MTELGDADLSFEKGPSAPNRGQPRKAQIVLNYNLGTAPIGTSGDWRQLVRTSLGASGSEKGGLW